MKRKCILLLSQLVMSSLILTSCSVIMAGKKEGTSIDRVQASRSRSQLLSLGGAVVSSDRTPTGQLVEVYRFKKETGSAGRAFMHGALDLSTCGVWEVIGTPIEISMRDNKCFVIKAFFDDHDNVIKMELV